MTLNVLYKDHGVGRQKELLAHTVRLRILTCRNDLNRKRIVSLQLIAFIFLPSVITQNGGRKRIFILFFCVIPPSQYPPSGSAGHLLINKEAYPIPILSVRIPFLNTAANPLLALWMTPYRIPSFRAEVRMLYEKTGRRLCDTERRIYYPGWRLTVSPHHGYRSFTFVQDDV